MQEVAMNRRTRPHPLVAALALTLPFAAHAAHLEYHGNLTDGGMPADGRYDVELTLYPAASGGSALAAPVVLSGVVVHGGEFSSAVDIPADASAISGGWFGARVRKTGEADFAALSTRTAATSIDAPATCNGTWALDGNAGNPAGSYLGNFDNQPLVLKVNATQIASLSSSLDPNVPDAPNVVFGSPRNGVGNIAGGTVAGGGRDQSYCGSDGMQSCGNTVLGNYGSVGGGRGNEAIGYASVIPGGGDNVALGQYSFAGGSEAYAFGTGTFVWADRSSAVQFGTQSALNGDNQFDVRATGGVNFVSGLDGAGNPASGVSLAPGAGSWSSLSDRASKGGIVTADTSRVLDGVLSLPISTWHYLTQSEGVQHLGPMAQDFRAAFGLGDDERHITEVDEGGVALAAIQGLNEKLEKDNASLRGELDALRARMDALSPEDR
jgi:hypothetical protein